MNRAGTTSKLVEREIEKKIDVAVQAAIGAGKKPANMGRRDFEAIARTTFDQFSPAARDKLIYDGVLRAVKGVLGEMLASRLWDNGKGYAATAEELVEMCRALRFEPPEDGPEYLEIFREELADSNREHLLETFKTAPRWLPLFDGQPAGAFLGEIATIKAAKGDPLALSFLAGREVRAL